jgi:penicillin-binding protein 2
VPDTPRIRLTVLVVVVGCLFAALLARLWFLQVVEAPRAQAAAQSNGIRLIYTPAPRGVIMDRNGVVLVGNANEPVIDVNRQAATQNPSMVMRLAALLGMSVKQLHTALNNLQYSPYAPVPVLPGASPEQILYIQEHQALFPGVEATTESIRTYSPQGKAAGNLLGYVGQISAAELAKLQGQGYQAGETVGQSGVEATYESVLRGQAGVEKVQVDSKGDVLGVLSSTPPVQGSTLRLSIDSNVQMAAVSSLEQGMAAAQQSYDRVTGRNFQAPAASAVVEDPTNGQVLALATVPSYDPSQFVGGISQANYQALRTNPAFPLEDRTIQGQYAPGSTFKLVTATAGLQYGLVSPNSVFHDTGSIKIGNFIAHNDNNAAYGDVNLARAITVSSDNYFNTIGLNLWYGRAQYGDEALQQVARDYGFAAPTGINLPNEVAGKIPTPASYKQDHARDPKVFVQSQWYPGNSDQLAIGQDEVLVTPLQLANAYAAFANGGTLWNPQVAADAESQAGRVVANYAPKPIRTIALHPDWRAAMLQGFSGVVNNPQGTAYGVFGHTPLSTMDIAGKTGTAQVTAAGRQDTSVFTSFAPAASPKYVVDAFVEDAGYGASVAAPVVRQIYDVLFNQPVQPITYAATGSGGQN